MNHVWCVWTESGDYEQFSRDLRGVFTTEKLARAHADQVGRECDACEVIAEPVMDEVPVRVPYVCWAAHIRPNGTEDHGLGFHRGRQFDTWSNELDPARGVLGPWSHREVPDLHIEVIGSDKDAVKTEYLRLLGVARDQLASRAAR